MATYFDRQLIPQYVLRCGQLLLLSAVYGFPVYATGEEQGADVTTAFNIESPESAANSAVETQTDRTTNVQDSSTPPTSPAVNVPNSVVVSPADSKVGS